MATAASATAAMTAKVWHVEPAEEGRWRVSHRRHGARLIFERSSRESALNVARLLARSDAPSVVRAYDPAGAVESEVTFG